MSLYVFMRRRKDLGPQRRLTAAERKQEEELRNRYIKTQGAFSGDVENARTEAEDAQAELRWLRRRAAIARTAARRVRISTKYVEEHAILVDLLGVLGGPILAPKTHWNTAREKIKDVLKLKEEMDDESDELFEFEDSEQNPKMGNRPQSGGMLRHTKTPEATTSKAYDVEDLDGDTLKSMVAKKAGVKSIARLASNTHPAPGKVGGSRKGGASRMDSMVSTGFRAKTNAFATLGRRRLPGGDKASTTGLKDGENSELGSNTGFSAMFTSMNYGAQGVVTPGGQVSASSNAESSVISRAPIVRGGFGKSVGKMESLGSSGFLPSAKGSSKAPGGRQDSLGSRGKLLD